MKRNEKLNSCPSMLLEICADSIQSVARALSGGADRIELCQNLAAGGVTPNPGLIVSAKKLAKDIPVFVLIRPREGDFCYIEDEIKEMEEDIKFCVNAGIDGFVLGALTENLKIDKKSCKRLLDLTASKPVTFHRAFDFCEPIEAISDLKELNFNRILTSGQAKTAIVGAPVISRIVQLTYSHLTVVAAGGIRPENIEEVVKKTNVTEVHSSARKTCHNNSYDNCFMEIAKFSSVQTSAVRSMKNIISSISASNEE